MTDLTIDSKEMTVEIKGFSAFNVWINHLDQKLKREMTKATKKIGFMLQRESRAICPVDEERLTDSISFENDEEKVRIFVHQNSDAGKYAAWVHDAEHGNGPRTKMRAGAGRKFISRAIANNTAKIEQYVEEGLAAVKG